MIDRQQNNVKTRKNFYLIHIVNERLRTMEMTNVVPLDLNEYVCVLFLFFCSFTLLQPQLLVNETKD